MVEKSWGVVRLAAVLVIGARIVTNRSALIRVTAATNGVEVASKLLHLTYYRHGRCHLAKASGHLSNAGMPPVNVTPADLVAGCIT